MNQSSILKKILKSRLLVGRSRLSDPEYREMLGGPLESQIFQPAAWF